MDETYINLNSVLNYEGSYIFNETQNEDHPDNNAFWNLPAEEDEDDAVPE